MITILFLIENNDNSSVLKSILKYVKRIDSRLYKIEDELKHGNKYMVQHKPLNNAFLSLFPINALSKITNIDFKLANGPEFDEQFVSFNIN